MSTKTTFKRIALVAVASMGFGVLTSIAPASATSTGFSLSKSSITVVGANTGAAVFRIQLSAAASVAATSGHELQSDETLTVSVVGVPTGVTATKSVANAAADLVLTEGSVAVAGQPYSTFTPAATGGATTTTTDGIFAPGQDTYANSSASAAVARSYYLRVTQNSGAAQDQGTYTLRFRLVKGSLLVSETTAKVTFVTSSVDSGAKLTLTRTGSTFVGTTGNITEYSETNNIKATIADANDGQVINADGTAPALTLDSVTSTGTTAQTNGTLALVDDGSTADFGYAVATTTANPVNLAVNGTYGGTWTSPVIASETDRLRVRYGAASAFATSLVYAASTATAGTASVTGTGITAGATAGTWSAPTSMTSATYTVALTKTVGAVQDEPVTITVTWSSSANAGDVKPVSGTDGAQIIKTDSTGRASITLTNSAPLNGQTATITATGTGATVTDQVITWRSARSASALTTPNADFSAALKSTNTVTFTFLDAFGAPVVNDLIALTISGANSALSTVTIPSARTNAQGQVSYTWTDAAAVTATATSTTGATDTITATSTTVSTASASRTVTYRTTVPVIAKLEGKFDRLAATTYADVVPATTIYTANGGVTAFDINTTKDVTKSLSSVTNDRVSFRYTAKDSAGLVVSGVPVTVSISAGGHIIGADGLPTASRIIYPTTAGLVDFSITATTTGTKTVTVTAGAVSATASVAYKNVLGDARVVSATTDTTSGLVTANVKDAFGNNVAGVALTGTLSAGAEFGSRSNSISVTTGVDGTASFSVLGTGTLTLAASSTTHPMTTYLAGFSDAIGATVQTGAPAGVRVVTLAVAGPSANDVAQAATDAAAEATDAANAATDAANAAAEAADAATAAAQDAADAVAALSTQVSEMVDALKKQITALTNLVIKIQKKVRA
jgi:trimeric autotransporter adhesin